MQYFKHLYGKIFFILALCGFFESHSYENNYSLAIHSQEVFEGRFSKNLHDGIFLVDKSHKIILLTFPKCASLTLVRWIVGASGLGERYGIDCTKHLLYEPDRPDEIYREHPNVKKEFLDLFCNKNEVTWHIFASSKHSDVNLYNDFDLVLKENFTKYIFVRNPYNRLITYYTLHYTALKKMVADVGLLKQGEEISFRRFIDLIYERKIEEHHFVPFHWMLNEKILELMDSIKIVKLENIEKEFDEICKTHNIDLKISNISNLHKNNMFGSDVCEGIYDLPLPFWNGLKPRREKEFWYDGELKEKVKEIYWEDFIRFGYTFMD